MMPEHLITRISITIQALFSSISTYIQCKLYSEEVIDEKITRTILMWVIYVLKKFDVYF